MFQLIKQAFISILGFSGSLATKCMLLNKERCMVRPSVTNSDPAKYYPFMISLDKCSESCNSADDLHT